MSKTARWIAGVVALTAIACGGGAASVEGPTPALHELARLNSTGRLDGARLTCALQEAPAMASLYVERLPEMRRARAELNRTLTGQHSQSVQQSMRASDRQSAATKAALSTAETAAFFDAKGDVSQASQYRSWAIGLRREAGVVGDIRPGVAPSVPLMSDESAALLLEYARLRSDFSAGRANQDAVDRMRRIERDDVEIVDAHAGVVLGAYQDPELSCSG